MEFISREVHRYHDVFLLGIHDLFLFPRADLYDSTP